MITVERETQDTCDLTRDISKICLRHTEKVQRTPNRGRNVPILHHELSWKIRFPNSATSFRAARCTDYETCPGHFKQKLLLGYVAFQNRRQSNLYDGGIQVYLIVQKKANMADVSCIEDRSGIVTQA